MISALAPKICVSIALDEVQSISKQADQAFKLGADYVEIRFDSLKPERLQPAIDAAKGIKGRAVFTLRSKDQGGKFAGSEPDRVKWLRRLAEQKPMLLDVELHTL